MGQYYSSEATNVVPANTQHEPRYKAMASPIKPSAMQKFYSPQKELTETSEASPSPKQKKRRASVPKNPSPTKKGRRRSSSRSTLPSSPIRTKASLSSPLMSPPTQPKTPVSRRNSLPKPPPKPVFPDPSEEEEEEEEAQSEEAVTVATLASMKLVELSIRKYGRKFEVIGRLLPLYPKQTKDNFSGFTLKQITDMANGAGVPSVGTQARIINNLVKVSGSNADNDVDDDDEMDISDSSPQKPPKAVTPPPKRTRRASVRNVPMTEVKRRSSRRL